MSYEDPKSWQAGTVTTDSSGNATFTFPRAFASGVVPIVSAIAVQSVAGNLYNVQISATPTNTSVSLRVNVVSGSAITLTGLVSLTLFSAAPSGVVVHVLARSP